MTKLSIRKGDKVRVIAGKDKGKKGKVRFAFPAQNRLLIEGVNMLKKHAKAKGSARQAGIIELEAPLHVSNVMLICNKCNHPTRIGARVLQDGKKVRVCRSCHEVID